MEADNVRGPAPPDLPEAGTYERSLYEAWLDLDYAIQLAALHCRLFSRLKRITMLVNFGAGSAAFVALFGPAGTVFSLAGAVVALACAADLIWDFGGSAAAHQRDKEAFFRLRGRRQNLSLAEFDSAVDKLQMKAASTVDALERPAYNDNLRRHGRLDCLVKLGRWERFVRWWA